MKILKLLSSVTVVLSSSVCFADAAAVKTYSGSLTFGQSQSAVDRNDGEFKKSLDLTLLSGIKISKDQKWSLGLRADASQDQINQEESDLALMRLSITRSGFVPVKALTTSVGMRLGLPVSRLQKNSYLQSSVGLITVTAFDISGVSKSLSLNYSLGATRNIHQFEENKAGDINTQYSISQGLEASYSFTDSFDLTVSGALTDSWTYQSFRRQIFTHEQSLNYKISETFAVSIGHTFDLSPTQKADGRSSNIKIFDETQSLVFGSVTVSI